MNPSVTDFAYASARDRALAHIRAIRGFYGNLIAFCILIPCFWLINFLASPKVIWAIWPTLGWGAGIVLHGLTVFASDSFFGAQWEERKVEALMARENLKRVSIEKGEAQAQVRMLQAQIEPHFLFNTLSTIQTLINRSPPEATRMMDAFIGYLRQSLMRSRAESTTLDDELALLSQYLDLLKIRMGERLQFSVHATPEIRALQLAPMLLQPIVENAITHGLEPKLEGGSVNISAREEANDLLIAIEDSGLGFGNAPDSNGTGLALRNIQERLALIYGARASLKIIDRTPGTCVQIRIPMALLL